MSEATESRGGIRLPRSAQPKDRDTFCKLLSFVDPDAQHGFGFEGKLFRPGASVAPSELRPDASFPEIPVILEYFPGPVYGVARRRDQVYVLWQLDWDALAWRELGRSTSRSWEWAIDLRDRAVRAVKQGRPVEPLPDLPAVAERIARVLDGELASLSPRDRACVLAVVHDQLAMRMSA